MYEEYSPIKENGYTGQGKLCARHPSGTYPDLIKAVLHSEVYSIQHNGEFSISGNLS